MNGSNFPRECSMRMRLLRFMYVQYMIYLSIVNLEITVMTFWGDKLVMGLRDRSLSEKLQLTKYLTLDVVIEMLRHHELIKRQNASQHCCCQLRTDS